MPLTRPPRPPAGPATARGTHHRINSDTPASDGGRFSPRLWRFRRPRRTSPAGPVRRGACRGGAEHGRVADGDSARVNRSSSIQSEQLAEGTSVRLSAGVSSERSAHTISLAEGQALSRERTPRHRAARAVAVCRRPSLTAVAVARQSSGSLMTAREEAAKKGIFLPPNIRLSASDAGPNAQRPEKGTICARLLLDVRVPTGPTPSSTSTIEFSPFCLVKDAMQLIETTLGLTTADTDAAKHGAPFGLHWLTDLRTGEGIWLMENRTLWSYMLQDKVRTLEHVLCPRFGARAVTRTAVPCGRCGCDGAQHVLEYKPKRPEQYSVRIVIPSLEIVSRLTFDQFTTVSDATREILKTNGLSAPDGTYRLYYARESLWLSETESLASYQLKPSDTLECKECLQDAPNSPLAKPKSVLLQVNLPAQNTTRKLLVSRTTTVGEIMNMILRKVSISNVAHYGLYLLPREGRPAMWMEDYKFLASFMLQEEETVEFRCKFMLFSIELDMTHVVRDRRPTVARMLIDDMATAQDVVELIAANYSIEVPGEYALFTHEEEEVPASKALWSYGTRGSFAMHAKLQPIVARFSADEASNTNLQVSFTEPVMHIMRLLARRYGLGRQARIVLRTATQASLDPALSLREQCVAPNACLTLDPVTGDESGGHARHVFELDEGIIGPSIGSPPSSASMSPDPVVSPEGTSIEPIRYIWDEGPDSPQNIVFSPSEPDKVIAGSLNKLIERLTEAQTSDLAFVKTFLLTYQSFVTPKQLLEKLIERYSVVRDAGMPFDKFWPLQRMIQARVYNAIKLWLETNLDAESESMLRLLMRFIRRTLVHDSPQLAGRLRVAIAKAKDPSKHRRNYTFDTEPPEPKLPRVMSTKLTLFDFDPEEIARQLTLVDFGLFAAIKARAAPSSTGRCTPVRAARRPSPVARCGATDRPPMHAVCRAYAAAFAQPAELLDQSWCNPQRRARCANVIRLIQRVNDLGLWVATTILVQRDAKERAATYANFVQVCTVRVGGRHARGSGDGAAVGAADVAWRGMQHLFNLHNFSTLMAILGGLNNSAILRLKQTKRELDKRVIRKVEELEHTMSPKNNYSLLRNELHSVAPPCIPFLAIYMSDLTFVDDGNPNCIDGLINFSKRRLVYSIISDLLNFQNHPYNLTVIPELKRMLEDINSQLEGITDKALYDISLQREPREE